jgi:hypothetical protein
VYAIVFFDCLRVKIRDEGTVKNKAVYLAIGVRCSGHREVLSIWIEETEGAKFWLRVMSEIRNRGPDRGGRWPEGLPGGDLGVFPAVHVHPVAKPPESGLGDVVERRGRLSATRPESAARPRASELRDDVDHCRIIACLSSTLWIGSSPLGRCAVDFIRIGTTLPLPFGPQRPVDRDRGQRTHRSSSPARRADNGRGRLSRK